MKNWIRSHPKTKRFFLFIIRLSTPVFSIFNLIALIRYAKFFMDWLRFIHSGGKSSILDFYPCLNDNKSTTNIDTHYFYQAIWAFKNILASGPKSHIDIGSSVDFVGLLTTITDVTFIDIRPLEIKLDRYTGKKGTILALPFNNNSVSSLSSLHVIEHIGLGRYGDPIDPSGSKKACQELQRIIASGGNLYLSLPVGKSRTCFNAHRVHSPKQILEYLPGLKLKQFSVVDDEGNFHEDVSYSSWDNLTYGCGMFHFVKHL